jgi:AcrR family transcriptional regulator
LSVCSIYCGFVAKAGAKSGSRSDGEATREKIVEAAIDTLCAEGFAGTSARSIAAKGGFNQALVFYHFGSVNDLLMASLAQVGQRRMEDYSAALGNVDSLSELAAAARSIFNEDLDRGYVKVLSELISGASTFPELGPRLWAEMAPWVGFTEEAVSRVVAGSPLEAVLPVADVAYAIVALYLGLELLAQLNGDRAAVNSLFGALDRFAALFSALFGATPSRKGDATP